MVRCGKDTDFVAEPLQVFCGFSNAYMTDVIVGRKSVGDQEYTQAATAFELYKTDEHRRPAYWNRSIHRPKLIMRQSRELKLSFPETTRSG